MSGDPTASANSTAFGTTSWGDLGNDTSNGTSSNDIWATIDWVTLFASHVGAKRLAISFLAWVVYDMAITIDDSINLFWKYRWSVSKAMYLISRYDSLYSMTAIVTQISVQDPTLSVCLAAPWIQLAGNAILIIVINLAMITRVYALWDRDIHILIFSLCGFSLNIGSYIILLSYSYAKGFTFVNIPPFTGCTTVPGYDKLWIMFVTSIAFEAMIISLTVYKSWSVAVQRGIKTPLHTLILEDGVVYFIVILLSQIVTVVALYVPSSISGPVAGSSPSIAVSGIACNRLFTRLQRLLLDKGGDQTGFRTEDFYTSSSPQTSPGGGATKQRTPSLRSLTQSREEQGRQQRSSLGSCIPKYMRNTGVVGSSDIVMEKVSRSSIQNCDSGMRARLERSSWRGHLQKHEGSSTSRMSGSLDKEIDLSGHHQAIATAAEAVRKSHGGRDHQKPRGEGKVEVKQSVAVETSGDVGPDDELLSHENEGPFTYGSGKSVLDPSPRFAGELSNPPDGDIGRLIVSRVGRYD